MIEFPAISRFKSLAPLFKGLRFSDFGLWAQTLWGAFIVRQKTMDYGSVEVHSSYYGFLGCALLLLAVLTALGLIKCSNNRNTAFDVTAVFCMIVASLLLAVPIKASLDAIALFGSVVGALGSSWMLLRWGSFYCRLPNKQGLFSILIAFALYFIGFGIITPLTGYAAFGILVALAGLSCFMLRRATSSRKEEIVRRIYYDEKTIRSFWRFLLAFLIYGFVLGMRKGLGISIENPLIHFLCHSVTTLVVFALMWWVFVNKRSLDFSRLFQAFMLLFATGFLLYPFSEGALKEFVSSMFTVAVALIFMLIWLGLVDVAHHSSLHPYVVFGVGWGLYSIGRPFGALFSDALQTVGNEAYTLVLALVLIYGVVICATFMLSKSTPGSRIVFSDLLVSRPLPELFQQIDERCIEIGRSRGLTDREIEVVQHMSKGRTKAYIAETLFISENTVRGHAKNAYTKLNVHNKQELLELIGI